MSDGAERIAGSFASFLKTSARELRVLEVLSRADCLAAAIYYNDISFSLSVFKIEAPFIKG